MLKKIVAGLCIIFMCSKIGAKAYRNDISTNQYVVQLKDKLTALHAEEAVL